MSKKQKIIYQLLIPLVLLLFPLVKAGIGVDYMDSMYTPGNFRFFSQMEGMWVIATYLSNVIGALLILLPGAETYLGLRIYTGLIISAMALISYFWLKKKLPPWLVAAGEVIAIGFCWCPSTILYNYLTYLFMLLSLLFLYEGLVQEKKGFLVLAGIFLGMNLLVRFPNAVEVGFILGVWLYGFWKRKKLSAAAADTLWCMLGYFASVGALMLVIIISYGGSAYVDMIKSLFSMTDSAASYKPYEMIYSMIMEYIKGLKWPAGMVVCTLALSGMYALFRGRFLWLKRAAVAGAILVLFRFYYAKGMFNVNYHTYPSMFQWITCFLIVSICFFIPTLFHKSIAPERKLLYLLALLVIGITPIGSNNNLYPIMNNLFFVAPVGLFAAYHGVKKAGSYSCGFPAQAMLAALAMALFIQSIGFGVTFSFRGAREGEKRDTKIEKNDILKGMYTNQEKAEAIEELTGYCEEKKLTGEGNSLILFGHIPGVSYFLDTPSALSTSWPDLESYEYTTFMQDMERLEQKLENGEKKPPVIVSFGVCAVLEDDADWMAWYENNIESGEEAVPVMKESQKLATLKQYLADYDYHITFSNRRFVVYEGL